MKKFLVVALAVATLAMMAPADAQLIKQKVADTVDAAAPRALEVRPAANNSFPFSVKNFNNTSEIVQFVCTGGGAGQLRVRNGANATLIQLAADGSKSWLNGGGNFGIGNSNPAVLLDVTGNARMTGTTTTGVLEITGGADVSEQFSVAGENVEPGTVVSIDSENPGGLRVSSAPYDRTVVGIISGANGINTGIRIGQDGSAANGHHPIALSGRVYVKADASNGAIVPGDMLTTSGNPGFAMSVKDFSQSQGAVIGKAMTPLDAGTGLVLVFVCIQ